MHTLITGGTGFLGRYLSNHLINLGHSVVSLGSKNADLIQQGILEKVVSGSFDQIFHLAAWTQAGDFCLHHGGEQWIINQAINTNVLAWWHKLQPQAKLVALGTSVSYATEVDLTEESYLMGVPSDKFFAYAMSKRMLYAGLLSLHKQFGLRYLYIIPSTVYGPNYPLDGRQLHFIYDIIRKIIRGKLYGEPVVLWGDGYQKRELVYIDDFIRIMLELNEKYENDIINIGAGEEYSIREFAEMICKKVGYDFQKIQFDTTKYVGARSKMLSTAKLKRLLPNIEMTPLQVGLNKTIEWFLAEQEKLADSYR